MLSVLLAVLLAAELPLGKVDKRGVGHKYNKGNRLLPFHALSIDTAGEGKPLPPTGTWELFVQHRLKMKQPLPKTLRQRQAIALSRVAATEGMSPFPGPLLSPPQAEWQSNMGATKLLLSPERVLQEIDTQLRAVGKPTSRVVVNIGAAVLEDRRGGGWSGDGQQEYCHRLYDLGYSGPAFDPSEAGLRRLGDRYPAVSLRQGYVTPANVVSLLRAYHAEAAAEAAAAVEASGAVVPEQPPAAAGVAAVVKVDIDAYDCAVLRALLGSGYRPFVLVVEINFDFPPPLEFAVHYSARWQGWKDDCHYGCSVAYATRMLGEFGYVLLQIDGWDALYVRADFAPLFGNVPHDALTVQALRPPMTDAEPIAGWTPPTDGSPVDWMDAVHADGMHDTPVYSHCRQVMEVFYNVAEPHLLVEFAWDYLLNMSHYQHTIPFSLSAGY